MKKQTLIAMLGSVVWVGIALGIVFWKKDVGEPLGLNEIGDFLAGVFSPLALWWLVLGYFQQGEELRLNTKALELQIEELKHSVEAQQSLANAAREQNEIVSDQYRRQVEKEAQALKIDLKVISTSLHYTGGSSQIVTIRNVGREAKSVSFELQKDDAVRIQCDPKNRLEHNEDIQMIVLLEESWSWGALTVQFTNKAGVKDFVIYFYAISSTGFEFYASPEEASESYLIPR